MGWCYSLGDSNLEFCTKSLDTKSVERISRVTGPAWTCIEASHAQVFRIRFACSPCSRPSLGKSFLVCFPASRFANKLDLSTVNRVVLAHHGKAIYCITAAQLRPLAASYSNGGEIWAFNNL